MSQDSQRTQHSVIYKRLNPKGLTGSILKTMVTKLRKLKYFACIDQIEIGLCILTKNLA